MISIPSPPPSHALPPWRPAPFLPPGRSPKSVPSRSRRAARGKRASFRIVRKGAEPGNHGVAHGDQEGQGEGEGDPPSHGVSPRPPYPLPCVALQARSFDTIWTLASSPPSHLPVSAGGFVSSPGFYLTDARVSVCLGPPRFLPSCSPASGLDNAGKTTIVKNLCGEDVSKTSPTLGFEIKTLAHNG